MANTTFSGPVRSESTVKTISKNATTGTITEVVTFGDGPISLSDGNQTLDNATHSGRILLVPDGSQDNTYTLPRPIAGSMFRFVYHWRSRRCNRCSYHHTWKLKLLYWWNYTLRYKRR